jgi:serine/threonine-protein kinase
MVQRLPDGEPQRLWAGGCHARYLPSGHLIYMNQGTLFAAAFDLDSLKMEGQPVPVIEEVVDNDGDAHWDVSAEGSLVYVKGSFSPVLYEFEWVDREGKREPMPLDAGDYGSFQLSPDGRYLAYSIDDGQEHNIWIYEFERGVPTKLTFDASADFFPIWSPSGESIVFTSERDDVFNLYWKRSDGGDEAQRLTESPNAQMPFSWHPGGDRLAIYEGTAEGGINLRIVTLEGDERAGWTADRTEDIVATPFAEWCAAFSPDGHWLAYASDESEEWHIYTRRFPEGDGLKQISIEGLGSGWPVWSRTSDELLFGTMLPGMGRERQVFIARYRIEGENMIPERPVRWEGATYFDRNGAGGYDLHPDGQRLLVRKLAGDAPEQNFDHVVLFQNFFDYLREKVPTSGNS